jgi:hypothetical protein
VWPGGGRAETLTQSVRYYTLPELQAMLQAAGLVPLEIYGGFFEKLLKIME